MLNVACRAKTGRRRWCRQRGMTPRGLNLRPEVLEQGERMGIRALSADLGVAPFAVHRNRLLSQLDHAQCRPLTLVVAPAGYGKTTLLSQWAEAHTGRL